MCGIIAVVRRPSTRTAPTAAELFELLDPVSRLLDADPLGSSVGLAADRVAHVDRLLRGVPGVQALLRDRSLFARLENLVTGLEAQLAELEDRLDENGEAAGDDVEDVNAAVVRL